MFEFPLRLSLVDPSGNAVYLATPAGGGIRVLNVGTQNFTVLGKTIAPEAGKPEDATAGQVAFAGMMRWPVTISYFDRAAGEKTGEQQPVYAITFELYENGVSRALVLDYGDFVLTGEMTSLELKDGKPCQ